MRFSLFIILSIFTSLTLQADFLTSRPVGPGIIHHHEYQQAGPWHIQVLEIDLTDSLNTLETVKAYNRVAGNERTSAMARRSDYIGHSVVGAINGDFYDGSGVSIGAQISRNTMIKGPTTRSVFALTEQKIPLINIVSFTGHISKQDSLTFPIQGVNTERLENQLILYNHYKGTTTGTNRWGTEIKLQYIQNSIGVNAPIQALVVSMDSLLDIGHGNMAIPATQGAVLSGHGLARDFLNKHLLVGDTLLVNLSLPPTTSPVQELIGGIPRIIRDGVKSVEWENESVSSSFAYDRHPRTAIGYSADSTKVYLFTVDGRQVGYSVGMSLFELADYMLGWDVFQGINLDGGGSTTMLVRGAVANSPSDAGGERSVSNALMVISKALEGPLAYLNLPWEETYTLIETQLQFSVTGTDEYYNPLALNTDSLIWSCDSLIGSISASGLFTATTSVGDGFVWVQLGSIIDSVRVHITDIASLNLKPDPVILKVGETQTMAAQAYDDFGHAIQVQPEAFTWSVSTDLASISAAGVVTAEHVGEGLIQASYHSVSASIPLRVGINSLVIVDDFTNTDNFTISGLRVDLDGCSLTVDNSQYTSAPSSGRLDYTLTTGGVTVLYLNCDLPISGTPESVSLNVFGDNSAHWLRGEFTTSTGDYMLVNFNEASPGINWDNSWKELKVPLSEATPKYGYPNAVLSFPITWTKIYLAETDENKKDSGTIYLDDFNLNYVTTGIGSEPGNRPDILQLVDNYPNPFNASTRFLFRVQELGMLELHIFSLDGREVDVLKHEVQPGNFSINWQARNLPSGVYLYRATLAQDQISGKCLLLK